MSLSGLCSGMLYRIKILPRGTSLGDEKTCLIYPRFITMFYNPESACHNQVSRCYQSEVEQIQKTATLKLTKNHLNQKTTKKNILLDFQGKP